MADYRRIAPRDIAQAMRGRVVIDPYRVMAAQAAVDAGFEYHTLGMPPLRPQ